MRASGRLAVGRDMAPGEYVLQVIVTDKLAKSKFDTWRRNRWISKLRSKLREEFYR